MADAAAGPARQTAPSGGRAGERSGQSPPPISVCIVCRNEADRLEPCLRSATWADEVLVLDLSSSDGSADVARRHGARVFTREPFPIVEPLRNELADRARNAWILALDPDERVTPGLAAELARVAARQDVDAVVTPRMNVDLGYPPANPLHRYEPQIRMYRRDRVRWPEVPNALPEIAPGRLHRLPSRDDLVIVHDRNRTIPEAVERALRYAPVQGQSMVDRGQPFSARAMLGDMAGYAHKQIVRGRAWEDGVPGLLRAGFLLAFRFYVWAAFWQASGARRTAEDDRLLRRLGGVVDALAATGRTAGAPWRLARRAAERLRRGG
ncbi:MAG TPA: glycosyltransferase family 2 protein [Gemmatimonadota bacterium]